MKVNLFFLFCLLILNLEVSAQSSWTPQLDNPSFSQSSDLLLACDDQTLAVFDLRDKQEYYFNFNSASSNIKIEQGPENWLLVSSTSNSKIWWSADLGQTWDSVVLNRLLFSASVLMNDKLEILVVANNKISRTTDLGNNWDDHILNSSPTSVMSKGSFLAVASQQELLLSSDFGINYQSIGVQTLSNFVDLTSDGGILFSGQKLGIQPWTVFSKDFGQSWDTLSHTFLPRCLYVSQTSIIYRINKAWLLFNPSTNTSCDVEFHGKFDAASTPDTRAQSAGDQIIIPAKKTIYSFSSIKMNCFNPESRANNRINNSWSKYFEGEKNKNLFLGSSRFKVSDRVIFQIRTNGLLTGPNGDSLHENTIVILDTSGNLVKSVSYDIIKSGLPSLKNMSNKGVVHMTNGFSDSAYLSADLSQVYYHNDTINSRFQAVSILDKELNYQGHIILKSTVNVFYQYLFSYNGKIAFRINNNNVKIIIDASGNEHPIPSGSHNIYFDYQGNFIKSEPNPSTIYLQLDNGRTLQYGALISSKDSVPIGSKRYPVANPNNYNRYVAIVDSQANPIKIYTIDRHLAGLSNASATDTKPLPYFQLGNEAYKLTDQVSQSLSFEHTQESKLIKVEDDGSLTYVGVTGDLSLDPIGSDYFMGEIRSSDSTTFDFKHQTKWYPNSYNDRFYCLYDTNLNLIDTIGSLGSNVPSGLLTILDGYSIYYASGGNESDFQIPGNTNHVGSDNTLVIGKARIRDLGVFVNEPETNAILFAYPNPTTNLLNLKIEGSDASSAKIQVFSLDGRLLLEETADKKDGVFQIEVKELKSSCYFIVMVTDESRASTMFYKH